MINSGTISGKHDSCNYPNLIPVDNYIPRDQPGANEDGLIKLNQSFNIDITAFDINQFTSFHNSLSILNVNLRGLNSNFALFTAFLAQLKTCIKVIIITESHTDNDTVKLYNLNGYRKASICRSKWGGGIVCFLHHSLEFNIDYKYTVVNPAYETLFFTLKCPGPTVVSIQFLCSYIPNRKHIKEFVQYLGQFPNRILKKNLIIVGDLNLCCKRDEKSSEFVALNNFLSTKLFCQLIEYPTFISYGNNPSILDHLWSNLNFKSSSFVFKAPISDHIPTITCFEIPTKLPNQTLKFRDFSVAKQCHFDSKIVSLIFSLTISMNDYKGKDPNSIEKRIELMGHWTIGKCDLFFPVMQKTVSHKRFTSPWLTSDLIQFINKKHRLFSLMNTNDISRETYSLYCSKLKKLLHIRENEYHKKYLISNKYDSRKKWNHVNSLMGRNTDTSITSINIGDNTLARGEDIPNVLIDHFMYLPVELRILIPPTDRDFNAYIQRNPHSLFLAPITTSEVTEIILKLKNNSSLAEIPTKFLKLLANHIAPLLANIFNDCIEIGYYPNLFKISNILPILKPGGDKTLAKYYRPIYLPHEMNKIFEKTLYTRMYSFFDHYELISRNQFGFLKNRSTAQATIKFLDSSLPAVKNENYTIAVALDLSKAFDCVDHENLLIKCEKYGIRGNVLKLIKSYLSNRKQKVRVGEYFSDEKAMSMCLGVPQGSCLGPLFYLIYANDINSIVNGVDIITFADDIVILLNGDNLSNMVGVINRNLNIIYQWCNFNYLTINPNKSQCIIFSNRRIQISIQIEINGQSISVVSVIKYLGIHLDSKFNFAHQLSQVNNKLSQICGTTWKLTRKFNLNTAKVIYYAFAYSHISYGISAWGGIFFTHNCSRTFSLHKRIVMNLFSWHFPGDNYKSICAKLNILGLIDIYKLNLMVLLFNMKNSDFLPKLEFDKYDNRYGLRNDNEFVVPFPRTNVLKMHFSYTMPLTWNNIPLNITQEKFESKFKNVFTRTW